ncbi:MAG: nucleotide exchange factor GrpE [Ignavibacteria bacterium GWB2_35_6b]|nr:MAG: nucleotide exchange factor GrpE [Ignavibacteria bacterium GWB2_35_6b]
MKKKEENMKEQKEKSAEAEEQKKEDNKIEIEFAEGKKEPEEIADEDNNKEGELISKTEKLQKEVEDLNDRLLRRAAEFENYKRRTENEFQNFLKYAGEAIIIEILPVYDDLGRSLNHVDEENSKESLAKGLKMVYDKFSKILEDKGVKKIDSKGHEFDFNFHEALLQKPTNEFPPNTVIEELEPGYMYKDKVIKHAKVIVSKEAE